MARGPNIILIQTDQHRRDLIGCYGGRHARTPLGEDPHELVNRERDPACAVALAELRTLLDGHLAAKGDRLRQGFRMLTRGGG